MVIHWIEKMILNFKNLARRILLSRKLNRHILPFIKLMSPLISTDLAGRLPVYGKICIKYSDNVMFFMLSNGDDEIVSKLYLKGIQGYEYETVQFILRICEEMDYNMVFMDIGANTGFYSLLISSIFKHSTVYAFEPYLKAFNRMIENINLNKFRNIQAFPVAMDEISGSVCFTNFDTHIGISTTNKVIFSNFINCKYDKVSSVSIDDFILNQNMQKIDLIKIDVEEHYERVLKGGKETFQNLRPIIICEVFSQKRITEFIKFCEYEVLGIKDHLNAILIPSEKIQKIKYK